ncbi:unnamed protein product [Thlaspi arvense]|uniref:BAHD acyltransferase n=1 Tax=Thlaspi arvense TaxID=13288 RepID=A0AAU9TCN7_THLAR|nr:unnamed protein product [Thlaspi arvense]
MDLNRGISTKIVRVNPATNSSDDSVNSLILPLTLFDLRWIKFHSNKRVIFYRLTDSSPESFHILILPKLELSLSLVLSHYLPLAGRLTWDPQDSKPSIIVSKDDTVSLTVAVTNADFSFLAGNGLRPATEFRSLVPELTVCDDSATVLSLQITLFPNQVFCIGIASHHSVLDGKTSTMFLKSWAHICRLQEHNKAIDFPLLPEDLTPSFDRTVVNVPLGLEAKMMELLLYLSKDIDNFRTLKPPPISEISADVVRVTLELTSENVEKLRERVKNNSVRSLLDLHLSTFVIAYAYALTCVVKARGGDANRPVHFIYTADLSHRLDPQIPTTYFGNCVFPVGWFQYEARTFLEEDGFVNVVEILSDSPGAQIGAVAGSTRLGVYGSDFGWGRPAKTEVVSIDNNEAFSMSERRDEPGGVEMGVCLKKSEMNIFLSLFKNGLSD